MKNESVSEAHPAVELGAEPVGDPACAGAVYICPMHAKVIRYLPGCCPKCGMSLAPTLSSLSSLNTDEDPQLRDFQKRFWWSLPLTLIIVTLDLVDHKLVWLASGWRSYFELIAVLPLLGWAGWPMFVFAYQSLVCRTLNKWILISVGACGAFFYSVVATTMPRLFPTSFVEGGELGLYFDTSALIISLSLFGQVLELKARLMSLTPLRSLFPSRSQMVSRIRLDGTKEQILLTQVKVGDRLDVTTGEKIPVDGLVIEGSSLVDESMLTGNALPVRKQAQAQLMGATLNKTGDLRMRVEKIGPNTVLAQIAQVVEAAQRSNTPLQLRVESLASYSVLFVLMIAFLTAFVWGMFGSAHYWKYGLVNAIAVLLIAAPSTLWLASHIPINVALCRAAIHGVLFHDAAVIERLAAIDTLMVDKSGALTEDRPICDLAIAANGYTEEEVLRFAASLDTCGSHPLTDAIISVAQQHNLLLDVADAFDLDKGVGTSAELNGRKLSLGNAALLAKSGVSVAALQEDAKRLHKEGASVLYLAVDAQLAGLISVIDPIKENSFDALKLLRKEGVEVIMTTHDGLNTARVIGQELGVDDIVVKARPQDKVALLEQMQVEGRNVAVAGEYVQNHSALTKADLGIAMNVGNRIRENHAELILIKGDLHSIAYARKLSSDTVRNIQQNVAFSVSCNLVGVLLAAGVLYPWTGWLLSPALAALMMSLFSSVVIFNGLRLGSNH